MGFNRDGGLGPLELVEERMFFPIGDDLGDVSEWRLSFATWRFGGEGGPAHHPYANLIEIQRPARVAYRVIEAYETGRRVAVPPD